MRSISENIYLKLPVLSQNIVLSIYGWHLNRLRYGHAYRPLREDVGRRVMNTPKEIAAYADNRVRRIVWHATRNVPYYRELFKKEGLSTKEIKSCKDLKKIPLLDKDTIRKDPRLFVSDRYDIRKLNKIHTTGTTGTPLVIYFDKTVRQENYAFYDQFLANNIRWTNGNRATFGGRIVVPPQQNKPPFWRYSLFQKNLLFSSYHLTESNIPAYLHRLRTFRPDVIDAYPSSLYTIASYAIKHGINLKGVTGAVTTSAETLYQEWRAAIEEAFGVTVFDQYGAAEMCVFAGQCKEGAYHIRTDYAYLEVLQPDGLPVPVGQEGELVCTGFINPVMPLIRYRIGDTGVLSGNSCRCGLPFPVLDRLVGRVDDFIFTPDGRKIGRLSPVLKNFPVKEAQYVQKSINNLEVRIVKTDAYSLQSEAEIVKELRKRLGNMIEINVTYMDSIPKGSGGKYKNIISELKRSAI